MDKYLIAGSRVKLRNNLVTATSGAKAWLSLLAVTHLGSSQEQSVITQDICVAVSQLSELLV